MGLYVCDFVCMFVFVCFHIHTHKYACNCYYVSLALRFIWVFLDISVNIWYMAMCVAIWYPFTWACLLYLFSSGLGNQVGDVLWFKLLTLLGKHNLRANFLFFWPLQSFYPLFEECTKTNRFLYAVTGTELYSTAFDWFVLVMFSFC